jgi:hypothetical protein
MYERIIALPCGSSALEGKPAAELEDALLATTTGDLSEGARV